jgi:hypothetical protein
VKQLDGTAEADVARDIEDCFAMLVDFAAYPGWYPEVVQAVEIVESDGDGLASRARTKLHVVHGPLVKDFDIVLAIDARSPESVKLARVSGGTGDEQRFEVAWALSEGRPTRIALQLHASLPVPRFVPVGGIGDAIADGFMQAATAPRTGLLPRSACAALPALRSSGGSSRACVRVARRALRTSAR